jgi:hypothetical protein
VEIALRVVAGLGGVVVVALVLTSAVRTVLVPRDERPWLLTLVVVPTHALFRWFAHRTSSEVARERVLSRFAPTTLLLLPLVWAIGLTIGFTGIYIGLGVRAHEALYFSGSSLMTLGFARPRGAPPQLTGFFEAFVGLVLIALLVSFLPTIYGHFSAREKAVSRLAARAGSPPTPVVMLTRAHRMDLLGRLSSIWEEWYDWMIDLEESHTSFPFLVWFRSSVPERSWITAAGAALDTAALSLSTIAIPNQLEAQWFIRSGYLALRRVADYFDIAYDPEPLPGDPISITQEEFDEVYDELARSQLPLTPDREQAWRDFAGWRVNYDRPLLGLCGVVEPPVAPWSSDRSVPVRIPLHMTAVNDAIAKLRLRRRRNAPTEDG